jgi:hypothetical protein
MRAANNREVLLARFAEQWSRGVQWHYAWTSWRQPAVPHHEVPSGRTPQEPNPQAKPTPPRADAIDRSRLDTAARWALVAFPGSIGELISSEISAYLSFGFYFVDGGFISRLADHVLGSDLPTDPDATSITSSTAPRFGKE